ncbi:unnamed protein product [Euphydryas editha]|uniref:Uncharacterized protein n=1 Tax=Euphydryas editha TaxID=104508 RepID=A0AAU9TRF5_EUPED|nr:unnamed protein product [Euphydryas editha]
MEKEGPTTDRCRLSVIEIFGTLMRRPKLSSGRRYGLNLTRLFDVILIKKTDIGFKYEYRVKINARVDTSHGEEKTDAFTFKYDIFGGVVPHWCE